MITTGFLTENQLDEWVRGNAREAQGVIVELVWRLVAASSSRPKERRFPLGDSIGQAGPDGVLNTDFGLDPFVPEGKSFWEIGTGVDAGSKATSDYKDLTTATPDGVRLNSVFVFVTPLSGRRDWPHTWKEDAQAKWLKDRSQRHEWLDVRVIDGTVLIDWVSVFPAVEQWLAEKMGIPGQQIQTPENHWEEVRTIGGPPPLIPEVFLLNRDEACVKLKDVFVGTTVQLKLDTRFPNHLADFVSAFVATLEDDEKVDATGRCLIISGVDGWNAVTKLREAHVLIADFDIDEVDGGGTKLLEKARRGGHAVVFAGMPGGVPHPNRAAIPCATNYQMKDALEKAGYNEERARVLAQKSDGNLNSLLRCLQNLSLMPEWAQSTGAADLAIAEMLGAWREDSEADKVVVKMLSGRSYGEWVGKIREFLLRPGTPLAHREGTWKFVARYEGWYALGPRIFDEHLDLIKKAALLVLRERDPQFELPPDERYAASVHGKVLTCSRLLRNGLVETLALMGSHPNALTSCSIGKAEATAALTVRELFVDADWVMWGSLNDLLPLLAEASPGEFLDAVEAALSCDPCPFDSLFAQEGNGIFGRIYTTGLLWALETLAWDEEYFVRAVVTLGEIAARDPGGKWTNRPDNSLCTILLPWLPQTCAPLLKRKSAVATLMKEVPDAGWKLMLALLPSSHQSSSGSRKPVWREIIPHDWSKGATPIEYREQVEAYAELALDAAKQDISRLTQLIDRLDHLSLPVFDQLLLHLSSPIMVSLPEPERLRLWSELVGLVTKHKKYANAPWAMKPNRVDKIAAVAEKLAPGASFFRHQRLFSERDGDLYEEKGNYEEQRVNLDVRRKQAIAEIFAVGGIDSIIEFAKAVQMPWRVGVAFGAIAERDAEKTIFPAMLESEPKALAQFTGGFVWGRYRDQGWKWVDAIETALWTSSQKGQLLAYLPFASQTWERSTLLLGKDESDYWNKTAANPYDTEDALEMAIDQLVGHGRTNEAVECLSKMINESGHIDPRQATRVLRSVLQNTDAAKSLDSYSIMQIITALQDNPDTDPEDLFFAEWAFLPLLDRHGEGAPKLLEQRLADDPTFFCEIIGTVFHSKDDNNPTHEPTEEQKNIATNAYRLLHGWQTPPGLLQDGTYDGLRLSVWVEKVKVECERTGRLEVALSIIGQTLIHTPPDPDGLWIHRAAASVLNSKDAAEMRNGFEIGLYNSRGVHWVDPKGQEERELAAKFRLQADEVELHCYHRLGKTLRDIAASYDREAERRFSRSIDIG